VSYRRDYALFGGSFDPVHNAHVIIAQKLFEILNPLKKMYIVPAGCSPFKTDEENTPFDIRYRWCESAFSGLKGIEVLDIERDTGIEKPSYTIDTLNRFYDRFGEYPVLVIGEDSLQGFHKWRAFDEIMKKTTLSVYKRRFSSQLSEAERRYPDRISIHDTAYIEISSTEIRERLRRGKTIRGFVPQSIEVEVIAYYRSKRRMKQGDTNE